MANSSDVADNPVIANRRELLIGGAALAAAGLTVARPAQAHAATLDAPTSAAPGTSSGQIAGVDPKTIRRWRVTRGPQWSQ